MHEEETINSIASLWFKVSILWRVRKGYVTHFKQPSQNANVDVFPLEKDREKKKTQCR